jgi:hypothetical protein
MVGVPIVALVVVATASSVVGEKVYRRIMRVIDEEYRLNDDISLAERDFALRWDRKSKEAEQYRELLRRGIAYYRGQGDFNSSNDLVMKLNGCLP